MVKVSIIGGGVSGLSAAYYLTKQLPPQLISLFEASDRTGGWIKSDVRKNGIIFEQAARTLRPRTQTGVNTLNLIEELKLDDYIVPILSSSPAARNRLIYANGKLHTLPSSFSSLFKTNTPFSKPLVYTFIKEHRQPKKTVSDESIYDFIDRRFGSEVADYLISPLICGICAGNAKEISVNFLMKELFKYEQKYGSITKGLLSNIFSKKSVNKGKLVERVKKEKWNVYSFREGLEKLPKKLTETLRNKNVDINLNTKCTEINFNKNGGAIIRTNNKEIITDHVFSTISSDILSKLMLKQHPELSQLLDSISNVTVAVINLSFDKSLINNPGFGFLVTPKENLPILGVIYDSCCFPIGDNTCLTVMMGGHWFNKHFNNVKDDKYFLEVAVKYLRKILNITAEPTDFKINIMRKCIPQYQVGHSEIVRKIRDYVKVHNLPISLCGMSYDGVGVNDVIYSAKLAADEFLLHKK